MPKPFVWLVGPAGDACFAPAITWLESVSHTLRVSAADTASVAARCGTESPAAIVFCALRPGQLQADAVESIHHLHPFSRLALLLGSWCEGEVRSGRPIAGLKRIYWHQWRELLPAATGLPSRRTDYINPPMPRTASEADWLESMAARQPFAQPRPLVAVCTKSHARFDYLAEALAGGGYRTVWQLPMLPLELDRGDVVLWDDWPDGPMAPIGGSRPSPPQILLLDFPRLEDLRRALACGFTEIVSRPFLLEDLWSTIEAATSVERPVPVHPHKEDASDTA